MMLKWRQGRLDPSLIAPLVRLGLNPNMKPDQAFYQLIQGGFKNKDAVLQQGSAYRQVFGAIFGNTDIERILERGEDRWRKEKEKTDQMIVEGEKTVKFFESLNDKLKDVNFYFDQLKDRLANFVAGHPVTSAAAGAAGIAGAGWIGSRIWTWAANGVRSLLGAAGVGAGAAEAGGAGVAAEGGAAAAGGIGAGVVAPIIAGAAAIGAMIWGTFKGQQFLGKQGVFVDPNSMMPMSTPIPSWGGSTGGVLPTPGPGSANDPRGMIPVLRSLAQKYGIDPDTLVKVATNEGLGVFKGDHGTSFGALQAHIGGGLGDQFQKETGLDPSDPANETKLLDWQVARLRKTGWQPYHGAARAGIYGFARNRQHAAGRRVYGLRSGFWRGQQSRRRDAAHSGVRLLETSDKLLC